MKTDLILRFVIGSPHWEQYQYNGIQNLKCHEIVNWWSVLKPSQTISERGLGKIIRQILDFSFYAVFSACASLSIVFFVLSSPPYAPSFLLGRPLAPLYRMPN